MYRGKYRFADKTAEIISLNSAVHSYCKEYETTEKADFTVEISQADIDYEKKKTESEFAYEGITAPEFSSSELEITAVYRKIADQMLEYDTFVFHGSAIAVDGKAYLFTAKSGTGKSTHTRLWRELLGDKAVMINDDKPMLCVTDTGILVYGTAYNGKHRLGNDISVPLKALCILERAEENRIERINKSAAYSMLLQQVYRPADPLKLKKTLELIDAMAEKTELYRLGCNMDISAAETAYNTMKG